MQPCCYLSTLVDIRNGQWSQQMLRFGIKHKSFALMWKRCLYICHYFYIFPTLFSCFLTCQSYFFMYILYMAKVQWQCGCAGLIICYQIFIAMLYINHGKVNRIYYWRLRSEEVSSRYTLSHRLGYIYCKHLMTEVKGSMIRDMHHLTMFHILVRWCITMGWAWASSKLLIYYFVMAQYDLSL